MGTRTELVTQKLEAHDLIGAVDVAIAEADEAKVLAVQAIAKRCCEAQIAQLNEALTRLDKVAESALAKYELL